jgi:hypothetical protein
MTALGRLRTLIFPPDIPPNLGSARLRFPSRHRIDFADTEDALKLAGNGDIAVG